MRATRCRPEGQIPTQRGRDPTETSEKKGGLPAQAGETTAQAQTPIEVKVEAQTEAKEEQRRSPGGRASARLTETSVEARPLVKAGY